MVLLIVCDLTRSELATHTPLRSFSKPNELVSIANHTFIMLDAPSLVEEDYRRYAAEVQLGEWEGVPGGVIEFVKSLGEGKSTGVEQDESPHVVRQPM